MRILIIEDDERFLADLADELSRRIAGVEIATAESQDEALERMNDEPTFDLILCDLKIPTAKGRVDSAVEHGLSVQAEARLKLPGVPLIVMSAFGTLDIVRQLYTASPQSDPFSMSELMHMSDFFQKTELPELVTRVEQLASSLAAVEAIDISTRGTPLPLNEEAKRSLKLFARRYRGVRIDARPVVGGLSPASVIRLDVWDQANAVCCRALARIGDLAAIEQEVAAFRETVLPHLGSGAFAHLIAEILTGAGRFGAAFYWFAGGVGGDPGYDETLFTVLTRSEPDAVEALTRLKTKMRPWVAASHQEQTEVRMVRRELIDDATLATIAPPVEATTLAVDDRELYVQKGPEHGDLHGANVLVRADCDPVLIDFAAVRRTALALDPVTLELSLIFHPFGPLRASGWPSSDQASRWFSLDDWAEGCPHEAFIRECRAWAHERATDQEICACAYSFALRQLQYTTGREDIARAIAAGAAEFLEP